MERRPERTAPGSAAYQAAADWLERLNGSGPESGELYAWLEWFGASAENRAAFEELQDLQRRIQRLPADRRHELRSRLRLTHVELRRSWLRRYTVAVLAAALGCVTVGLGVLLIGRWPMTGKVAPELVFRAPADQHREVILADGSELVLGPDAIATASFTAARRSVSVEKGAAYFEVRHDTRRPFVVHAGSVRVTAVGTAFNVVRDPTEVAVTVTDGIVELADDGSDTRMGSDPAAREFAQSATHVHAGQRAVVRFAAGSASAAEPAASSSTSLVRDRFEFVDAPLSQVIQAINHGTRARLLIDDPRVADLRYSGTVLPEHLPEWIASLPRIYDVRVVPLEDGSITLVTRAEPHTAR